MSPESLFTALQLCLGFLGEDGWCSQGAATPTVSPLRKYTATRGLPSYSLPSWREEIKYLFNDNNKKEKILFSVVITCMVKNAESTSCSIDFIYLFLKQNSMNRRTWKHDKKCHRTAEHWAGGKLRVNRTISTNHVSFIIKTFQQNPVQVSKLLPDDWNDFFFSENESFTESFFACHCSYARVYSAPSVLISRHAHSSFMFLRAKIDSTFLGIGGSNAAVHQLKCSSVGTLGLRRDLVFICTVILSIESLFLLPLPHLSRQCLSLFCPFSARLLRKFPFRRV